MTGDGDGPSSCAAAAGSSPATVSRVSCPSWPGGCWRLMRPCSERCPAAVPGPAAASVAASSGLCEHLL